MKIHRFTPTHYFNTIGSHEPVLHIAPGDTVITTTVDAHGQDAADKTVTAGRAGRYAGRPHRAADPEPGDRLGPTRSGA
jgi:amidase